MTAAIEEAANTRKSGSSIAGAGRAFCAADSPQEHPPTPGAAGGLGERDVPDMAIGRGPKPVMHQVPAMPRRSLGPRAAIAGRRGDAQVGEPESVGSATVTLLSAGCRPEKTAEPRFHGDLVRRQAAGRS